MKKSLRTIGLSSAFAALVSLSALAMQSDVPVADSPVETATEDGASGTTESESSTEPPDSEVVAAESVGVEATAGSAPDDSVAPEESAMAEDSAVSEDSALADATSVLDVDSDSVTQDESAELASQANDESAMQPAAQATDLDADANQNQELSGAAPETTFSPRPSLEPRSRPEIIGDGPLVFNFSGASWQDVLEWFVDQADLSLQIDKFPAGTVRFSDPTRAYSVSEGLDILNRLLLDRGYALVRRGRMLLLIDLEDSLASKLISELSELVQVEDLDQRSNSDIVSCVFPLGSLTPDAAREEIAQLVGPWGRVIVLDSARQVKVTETVSKLLAIRQLLENAKAADSSVTEIVLEHRGSEELLEVARPLVGLEPGENLSDDLRISVSLFGDRIYATGLPGKVSLLESIISKADKPLATPDDANAVEVATPVFETHRVAQADSATVFDVLQTLLAGTPDTRIAIEPKSNAIVAFARPETHAMIAATIAKLEGSGQDFKVINLRRLEPAQALLTINKFFGVSETGGDGPIVDGDPTTNRLWVRGKPEQITMVEKLIEELEGEDVLGALSDKVRVLPYSGQSAEDALRQVQGIWSALGRQNQIRTVRPAGDSQTSGGGMRERRIHSNDSPAERVPAVESTLEQTQVPKPAAPKQSTDESPFAGQVQDRYHLVHTQADQSAVQDDSADDEAEAPSVKFEFRGSDIVVQFSPAGMIVASEDVEALNAFEALMSNFASSSALQSELPTIFWLKYAKADATAELISSILSGADSSFSSMADSLGEGLGGLGGGMLGLLGMGGGGGGGDESSAKSILTATGSVSIVPDARLNALIVQANPIDLEIIEMILQKLDIQESPEDVELIAKPALIPVIYQDAKQVAEVVKSVFADRMQGANDGGGRGGGQPNPQEIIAALRGGGRGGNAAQAAKSERSKISVAVDERSNSLVVTATPQDFEQVRELVVALDEGGMQTEESVEVVTLSGNIKADVMKQALESVLGTTVKTSTATASSNETRSATGGNTPTPAADSGPSADEIRRRIEMFRQMREGGGGAAGGFGGRPGGTTGGRPTGGRGGR